ncbi:MAG: HAD-IC family P-type ATPase [Gemmiger sp.]|uniref:HAD-IC family P-type ATPase n=1 Tax=Gemmiger sp. TaxID=2049027 RepID=UPI002E7A8732|nr:HAD-IC family P-type ATPase [Gemmiger sp.]MEE0800131.1 HAD-IC family P-type ATPase [Gemmiger sp.]
MLNLHRPQKPEEVPQPVCKVPPLETDPAVGLTGVQVEERMAAGLDNRAAESPTRSDSQIVRDNIFTFFNLVFVVLAVCLALVGSYANMTFLGVVIANTVIGIVQQLRSKHTVDQLTLVAAHKVRCLRSGEIQMLPSDHLVRDDIVEFTAGEQICADAVVCSGSAHANEALITGEAEPVSKAPGDQLRSGSFLVSGRCTARLTRVGADSYANRLATEAREGGHKVPKGEMMRSLDKLIRVIGIALIPMGIVMFCKQYVSLELPLRDSVEATVAALIGMIPEGLYLLTSVALAVSMIRLARRKVLAQDMNCIETLARVDVLCVDKTGTITEARMEAADPLLLAPDAWPADKVLTALRSIYAGTEPDNDTARALVQKFAGTPGRSWERTAAVPFDSAYKWSAATFGDNGSFVVGAPEFVAADRYPELADQVSPFLEKGSRVLLLAHTDQTPDPRTGLDTAALKFVALLPVANRIRPEAPQTFRYFAEQGVQIKVISGDNPVAVSEVARQAGIPGAEHYVDAATLTDDAAVREAANRCTVFGRVTPAQKRKLVKALQAEGHTVAMTGDGVNDVLALKDADCGIAMASGAQAASQVAQLVLLESDFSGLPAVVAEGRRVINNIQRSASLFLVKNIFSFLLTFVTLFVTMPYPLQPLQLTLLSAVTIGIPSFALALEPNRELIRGKFILNVLRAALPGGLTDLLLVLGIEAFVFAFDLPNQTLTTITTVLLLAVGLAVLWDVCKPFTPAHAALWGGMAALTLLSLAVVGRYLELTPLDTQGMLVLVVFLLLVVQTLNSIERGLQWLTRAGNELYRRLPRRSDPQ